MGIGLLRAQVFPDVYRIARNPVTSCCAVVVPDHRELDRGTLRAIIRRAGPVEEFVELLQ
jgi:hypothetical protein